MSLSQIVKEIKNYICGPLSPYMPRSLQNREKKIFRKKDADKDFEFKFA